MFKMTSYNLKNLRSVEKNYVFFAPVLKFRESWLIIRLESKIVLVVIQCLYVKYIKYFNS